MGSNFRNFKERKKRNRVGKKKSTQWQSSLVILHSLTGKSVSMKSMCISFSKHFIWKFLTLIECILSTSTHHNLQPLPHDVHFIIRPIFDLFFLLLLVTHWVRSALPTCGARLCKGEWLAFYCAGLMHKPNSSKLMAHASFPSPITLLLSFPGGSQRLGWREADIDDPSITLYSELVYM